MNKIISYIGFAIRSHKVIAGQSPLKHNYKEKIHVILVCNTASDNLKNLAKNVAIKKRYKRLRNGGERGARAPRCVVKVSQK